MEFSIKLPTIKSGWSIVHVEGLQVIISKKKKKNSFSEIDFVLANSADHDEMPYYVAFHQGLHCLPKYPFWDFWSSKGY